MRGRFIWLFYGFAGLLASLQHSYHGYEFCTYIVGISHAEKCILTRQMYCYVDIRAFLAISLHLSYLLHYPKLEFYTRDL